MFGITSNFKCPCCDFIGEINLGITNFIDIKGKESNLAVNQCPKCKKLVAFKIVEKDMEPSVSFDLSTIDKKDIIDEGIECF